MTAHSYSDLFNAKLGNLDLVLFVKHHYCKEWQIEENRRAILISDDFDYFLCLPKHKEECLHWLNGGDVEFYECGRHHTINSKINWAPGHLFMGDMFDIRIKPRKEKRWIFVGKNVHGEQRLGTYLFEKKSDCELHYADDHGQFIEIEVEI